MWGRDRVGRPGVGVTNTRRRGDFRVHGGNLEGMVFVWVGWLGKLGDVGLGGISKGGGGFSGARAFVVYLRLDEMVLERRPGVAS